METQKILDAIASLKIDIDNIQRDINSKFKVTADIIDNHKERINKVEQICKDQERIFKEKNLLIFGINEEERHRSEMLNACLNFIKETLKTEISIADIDNIYRIGSRNPGKPRPILLKLTSRRKLIEIISNRKYLKGSKIIISEDFPKQVVEERKLLIPLMKECRREGKHAVIKYNELFVDGKKVNENELSKLLKDKNEKKRHRSEDKTTEQAENNETEQKIQEHDPKKQKQKQRQGSSSIDTATTSSNRPIFEFMQRPRTNSYDERPIKGQTTNPK